MERTSQPPTFTIENILQKQRDKNISETFLDKYGQDFPKFCEIGNSCSETNKKPNDFHDDQQPSEYDIDIEGSDSESLTSHGSADILNLSTRTDKTDEPHHLREFLPDGGSLSITLVNKQGI